MIWQRMFKDFFKLFINIHLASYFFHDGDRYHIETSPLICSADQWTGA